MNEESIFAAALELSPSERSAYLANVCGDAAMRQRLEGLLAASDRAGNFMVRPAVASANPANAATEIVAGESTPHDATITHDGQSRLSDEQSEATSFLSPSSRPDSLGRIGHYEVLEILGKGGFGIVFRAFDDVLQRVVAIKVMAPQLAATSPARKRFLREARTSAQVRHENVVQVYEVAESPLPYLAMEFIPGETLQERLNRIGPLEVAEVLRIGRQIAEGLAAAHGNDLIHRDIKPSNVLIEGAPQQRVKITDFGLARAADDASISQSGIIAGTPMFMAPEQALGHKLDQRADLFSLGSVLYQMMSGRPPFRANSTVAVLKRVAEDRPRDIREIIPETPQWLCNIIAKLHEKKPEDRYQSAREIADVLADCEQQLKAHGAIKDYSRIPGGNPQPRRTRRKWKRAAAAVVLLLVVAGIAYAGPYTLRYAFDAGKVTFTNDEEKLLVRRDGQIVATLDAASPSVHLASGEYELEAVCAEGYEPSYYVAGGARWLFGSSPYGQGSHDKVFKLTVGRGDRIRVGVGVKEKAPPPSPVADGWVQLFNGKDLTGWKPSKNSPGHWQVQDGVIVGSKGPGYLFSTKSYDDFHLRVEARINGDGNSGVSFRRQFQAEIRNDPLCPTGTILEIEPAKTRSLALYPQLSIPDNEWFRLEIRAEGPRLSVRINDGLWVSGRDNRPEGNRAAPFELETGSPDTVVQFRKIEIKELPPDSLPPAVELSKWDTFVDPRGECSEKRDGRVVSIKVPGTRPYNLLPLPGFNLDAPRLVQEMEGDFLIQATVKPYERPKPNTSSRPDRPVSFRAAGLLVWVNEQTFLRFERASYGEQGNGAPYLNMEWYVAGQPGKFGDGAPPLIADAPTHLQIERRDRVLYLRRSDDGHSWTDVNAVHNMNLPQRVSVGLVTSNSTNTEFTAAFDDLRLRGRETSLAEPGWVKLFNGKDLSGWKEKRVGPSGWKVEGNVLKANPGLSLTPSILNTERSDFRDFHLRMELRTNSSTKASIDVRSDGLVQNVGYGVWLMPVEGKATPFSLTRQASTVQNAKPAKVKSEEWYQLELIARGSEFQVKVDNELVAQWTDDNPLQRRGPITIFQMVSCGMLEFRKIEIKELPASSPEVPKTAAEVLPFLAGNWKVERQTVDPKVPSDKGTVTHGFVAGGRFLRGHCSINEPRPDGATIEGLDFWCFEPGQNSLRRWVARSDGFTAFISGRFHPASRTLITTLRVGADDRVQQYEFVDPDTFNFQVFQKDASGMITGGFSHKCIRVKEPVAVPRLPLDPMRPEEMKVLDRLVGEWHNDKTISVARLFGKSPFDNTVPVVGPDMTSGPAVRVKAAPILGGRFIEKFETNVATGVSDYTLSWFDTAAKKYRTWCFNHTGSVTEFTGTWDEAAKTLIWNSADGGLEGRWVFKSDDSREFRHVVKDKDGKVLNEATGKSRRIAANPLPATHKNSLGMEFVIVPKGKSWLGGGKDKLGDKEVEIPADFYLGKYEVTQEEWEKVMGENPSHFSRAGGGIDVVKDVPNADLRRFPVEYVSWNQCLIFVEKLNQLEKETGWVYRLPTEVEWEHACRGGGGRPAREYEFDYYLDQPTNTVLHNQANFNFGENALNRTCKVGSYQPNRLGLYDMHGNVWEWCHDQVMDQGVSKRSTLGGGWELDSLSGRAWFRRTPHPPSHRHQTMGLRLARVRASAASPDAKTPAIAPFTDADVKRIAALPAAEQIEEIRKELMKRNPGFGGNLRSGFGPEPIIADGIVTHLAFETDNVSDISPVRALTGLRELHCNGSKPGLGRLTDLSPLKGMPLASLSVTCNANLTDLSALQGLPLKGLHVGDTGVTSIKVLEDMPLAHLWLHGTPVADLSPLAGKSLATLHCSGTRVENLKGLSAAGVQTLTCDLGQLPDEADLKRLGVKELRLERVPAIIDLERLRKLGQRLTRINNKPAEEFWKEVEKK